MESIPELQQRRTRVAGMLRAAIDANMPDMIAKLGTRLLEIDEQINPSKDAAMTWNGPQTLRETVMEMAKQEGMSSADLLSAELHLQQIENLPPITPFDKRALHMGCDPATVYQGEDLKLYQEIKEREAEG